MDDPAPRDTKSFWNTLPGLLTGIAGLVSAIAVLLTALYTTGVWHPTPAPTGPSSGSGISSGGSSGGPRGSSSGGSPGSSSGGPSGSSPTTSPNSGSGGNSAGKRTPKLPAPRLLSPPNGAVFNSYPRTTTLTWQAVPGATSYNVERVYLLPGQNCPAGATPATQSLIVNTPMTMYIFNFVGAQPGCWRVSAVDVSGNFGAVSPWREFVYTR